MAIPVGPLQVGVIPTSLLIVHLVVFSESSSLNKFKGIVHLNIIFSYMKVNKICNLDHPVY